jgi:hypothetical protein
MEEAKLATQEEVQEQVTKALDLVKQGIDNINQASAVLSSNSIFINFDVKEGKLEASINQVIAKL